MSLNWREINLILEELSLPGSRVQKVEQPDFHTLILTLYDPKSGRRRLLASVEHGACRIHLLSATAAEKKVEKLQRFAQLLRSRLIGGRISSADQLWRERIVRLTIEGAGGLTNLYIRLWSGAGNIIAADEQKTVLDTLFRRPRKGEISGKSWDFTPPSDSKGDRQAFSIRPRTPGLTFNEQIEQEYRNRHQEQQLEKLREQALGFLDTKVSRLQNRISRLEQRLTQTGEYEQLRRAADLLSANAHLIQPKSSWIEVYDYAGEQTLTLALNPSLTPGEQIEHYYSAYRKAKGATENLAGEIRQDQEELKRTLALIRRISGEQEDSGRAKLKAGGGRGERVSRGGGDSLPGLRFQSGPFTILIGRSADENDRLLRRHVRGSDYWLHTRDFPGGYVFIKAIKGKSIPLETLLDAGNLALFYSKGRSGGKGELYYTQVKYLRRAKDGPKGLVLPTQEKNLSIVLDRKRLDALFERAGLNPEESPGRRS